ncbi:acyltransferase [Alkalimarinus coralli]|uniref:acyltransferase n=1 Tax=Alkalimarinus coralli TaxID=2935863 RepID=UPI00202ADB1A|nr:acyltransferase [Alkalimarinus coralli]
MNNNIHPTALISDRASIGKNTTIGPFSVIHDNVIVGDNCQIDGFCELGYPTPLASGSPLEIGHNSIIRSHSVFYEGSSFGDSLSTGHRVTVREGVAAGCNLQIGTLSDLQGDCIIGDYVRCHSNVHIGKASKIGNFVWIFPYCVLTNDPHPPSNITQGVTVDDFAVIATMTTLLPGVKVGHESLVAAHSCVSKHVSPHTVVGGSPAKQLCMTADIKLKDGSGNPAYPWANHFHRGYPEHIVNEWVSKINRLRE